MARKDWESIEPEWRAGIKSVLQISAWYKDTTGDTVSHTAINKHFKKLGIPRDLAAKVKAKADAMVSAAVVSDKVSTETTATDADIINANAKVQSDIILSHRSSIPHKRELVAKLFAEVESITDNGDLISEVKKALRKDDMKALADTVGKLTTLPTRIKGVTDLVSAFKVLVGMERQAFGIDNDNSKLKGTITLRITGDESDL